MQYNLRVLSAINSVPVTTNTLYLIIEIVVGFVVSAVFIRSNIPKQTIKEQSELIKTYLERDKLREVQLNECTEKHKESEIMIAKLQGQVDVLRSIPLTSIDSSMKRIATSNSEILKTLNKSAIIAATDKDLAIK